MLHVGVGVPQVSLEGGVGEMNIGKHRVSVGHSGPSTDGERETPEPKDRRRQKTLRKGGKRELLTLLQKERQYPGEDPDTVQGLIEVDTIRRLHDLTELRRGLREQGRQVVEPLVPKPAGRIRGDQLENLLGRAGDLPKLVPEFGVVWRYVHLHQGRYGLAELLPRGGRSHGLLLVGIDGMG